jgi:hypothetical protein
MRTGFIFFLITIKGAPRKKYLKPSEEKRKKRESGSEKVFTPYHVLFVS